MKNNQNVEKEKRMQGRQNMSNMERKGPHKSMHCKFCKPPGVVTPEKPTRAQMETKTKLHLAHEAADLRVCNIHNEPGFPTVESEACICVLEGENSCPKCVRDKNKPPPKKKVCRCPKGAKPHPSMFNQTTPKKKKKVEEDDEFWWEKYSREHDALAKETWAAYMAQRRKDKKLEKCQRREKMAIAKRNTPGTPTWFARLSCQQIIYVEYLSTAIRLDSDENITDRTNFVLGGIGLYPRPKKKVLKKCLKYCHYNSIHFLNQLHIMVKDDDPFQEKKTSGVDVTWNEKLIMNSLCHLEFPGFLREIRDRLPPLPRAQTLPQIPYPVYQVLPKKKYNSPYEEPIWQDRINWMEKDKIDRLNRARLHMETKRMKIPPLALVRRPSLIDARPRFLAQIEANERASRRLVKEKRMKVQTKKRVRVSTFNSAIDVTAIAGIEASEISTSVKADTDDICVFLREPKEEESLEGEGETLGEEEHDFSPGKEVTFMDKPPKLETQMDKMSVRDFSEPEDRSEVGEGGQGDDIPFKTPPKTLSGGTIASPCPPPDTTPGPPAPHYDKAKRELDVVNEQICGFFPFVTSSTQSVKDSVCERMNDIESNLKSAAAKLKKLALGDEGEEKMGKKGKKKNKKKDKCGRRVKERKKSKKSTPTKRRSISAGTGKVQPGEGKVQEEQEEEEEVDEDEEEEEEEEEADGMQISFKIQTPRDRRKSVVQSEESDPDPDSEDEWSMRPPCMSDAGKLDSDERPSETAMARVIKKRKGKLTKRKSKKKKGEKRRRVIRLEEETGLYRKKKCDTGQSGEKETMTESSENNEKGKEEKKEEKDNKVELFTGDVSPLVNDIIKDLAEEGFYCASYSMVEKHPDVEQLIKHLRGEILNKKLRNVLRSARKLRWSQLRAARKFPPAELGINPKVVERANWNDKKWISQLAKKKIDQFYYKVAYDRAQYAIDFDSTLYLSHFGTERYQKIFNAYMLSRYQDAILRGIF